jgi:hypothetical protein
MARQLLIRSLAALLLALMLFGTVVAAVDESKVVVYITETGEKYHKGSCRYLKKSKIETNLKQAKEDGYDPCKVCKPPK